MKLLLSCFFLITIFISSFAEYKIELHWDEFEGECNGYISGTIGEEYGFVQGAAKEEALSGQLVSIGEGRSWDAQQVFWIYADYGFFTFWLKDKFADEDFGSDPQAISNAHPLVKIFQDGNLIKQIGGIEGEGLTCRIFNLDAASGDVVDDIRFYSQTRIITGNIIDAVNGQPLPGTKVSIVDYMGEIQLVESDGEGGFTFRVGIGEYELSASLSEYIGSNFMIRMGADETPRELVIALTKPIEEYRMVLTWGSSPKDLDAHLTGPDPAGGIFHIWYRNKVLIGGRNFLDLDDTSSYGPETITIYKPAVGEYYYSVHDYSNKGKKNSKRLSQSGARVDVYGENRLVQSFDIPPDNIGNCWHVFKIDRSGIIVPLDTIDFITDERNIR